MPHYNDEEETPILLSDEVEQNDTDDDYEEESVTLPGEFHETLPVTPSKAVFIVYWTSLVILLKRCLFPACYLTTVITNAAYKGSQLIVTMKCQGERQTTWKS